MTTTLRLLALAVLALSFPACASTHKTADCCSSSGAGKCAAGDSSCHAPMKKKHS